MCCREIPATHTLPPAIVVSSCVSPTPLLPMVTAKSESSNGSVFLRDWIGHARCGCIDIMALFVRLESDCLLGRGRRLSIEARDVSSMHRKSPEVQRGGNVESVAGHALAEWTEWSYRRQSASAALKGVAACWDDVGCHSCGAHECDDRGGRSGG